MTGNEGARPTFVILDELRDALRALAPDVVTVPDPRGDWYRAAVVGANCAGCDERICLGDPIRDDGQGGTLCQDCGSAP
jgi:hypothetical protein